MESVFLRGFWGLRGRKGGDGFDWGVWILDIFELRGGGGVWVWMGEWVDMNCVFG